MPSLHLPQTIGDRVAAAKDFRNMRNKGVLRLHERLNRDQTKKQEDDRSRRLGECCLWRAVLWAGCLCLEARHTKRQVEASG